MHRFGDFAQEDKILEGSKMKIDEILNIEIIILGYKIKESKYKKNASDKCLTLQIDYADEKHVVFTGSEVLANQITKYENQIPFRTVIQKIDKYYTFT